MKHLHSFFYLFIFLHITSCGSEDPDPPAPESLSFTTLTQDVSAQSGEITFTANLDLSDFTVAPQTDWLTITTSGTTLNVAYEENVITEARSGEISVVGSNNTNITLTINQAAGEVVEETAILYAVTNDTVDDTLIDLSLEDGTSTISQKLDATDHIRTWIGDQDSNVAYGMSDNALYTLDLETLSLTSQSLSSPVINGSMALGNNSNIYYLSGNDLVSIDISSGTVASIITLELDSRRLKTEIFDDQNSDLLYIFWTFQDSDNGFIDRNLLTSVNTADKTVATEEFMDIQDKQNIVYGQSADNEIYRIFWDFSNCHYQFDKINVSTLEVTAIGNIDYQVPSNFLGSGIDRMVYNALTQQLVVAPRGTSSGSNKALIIYDLNTRESSITSVPEDNIAFRYTGYFFGK